jgi:predicted transcriptional regulator
VVTEIVKRAEALLDVSRDLNMSELAKDLEEIISVVDRPLEKLMSYVALLH